MVALYIVNSQVPQIIGSATPFTPKLTPGDVPAILRSWQIGQIFTAEVLAPAADGATLLRINDALISAQTALPLMPGQTLQVKVVANGEPPLLQMVNPQTAAATTAAETLNQSLRAALPRQTPLSPLLANLDWLAQTKNGSLSGLSPAVVETARQVFSRLSTPQDLSTSEGLSASLQRSGIFLEARLSQADTTVLESDFKAGLLRLREVLLTSEATASASSRPAQTSLATAAPDQLPPQSGASVATRAYAQAHAAELVSPATSSAPPPLRGAPPHAQPVAGPTLAEPGLRGEPVIELLSQVQGGLARVQLSQLASLPNSDSSPAWTLELPVRHAGESHVIQMQIEADAQSSHAERSVQERKDWAITLAMNLTGLGPLHIKVSLRDEKISASLWADQSETVKLLTQHLDQLRKQMSEAGLDVASVRCAAGCSPVAQNRQATPALLDIKI